MGNVDLSQCLGQLLQTERPFSVPIRKEMTRTFRRWPMILGLPMGFLMAQRAKGNQIVGRVIAQSAAGLDVMDLKILHTPTRLAAPAISLQDFTAEPAISFKVKLQPWPAGTNASQSVTCTFSRSCSRCSFGRPMASRVRQGNRASRSPASRLTPARKSAQIISRQ